MKKFVLQFAFIAIAVSSVVIVSCGDDDKKDDPTPQNLAPTVSMTNPGKFGRTMAPGRKDSTITIMATAIDSDGTIKKVEFYIDGAKIGEDLSIPYSQDFTFSGDVFYAIKIVATDDKGSTGFFEKSTSPVGLY